MAWCEEDRIHVRFLFSADLAVCVVDHLIIPLKLADLEVSIIKKIYIYIKSKSGLEIIEIIESSPPRVFEQPFFEI